MQKIFIICLILLSQIKAQEELTYLMEEIVQEEKESCWVKAYGRGMGEPISTCRDGEEKDGLLCYPFCNEGYTGAGPVCWQNCPDGFRNDGAFCYKPNSYGRGFGYWSLDHCVHENPQGCEQYWLLYYPKCAAGFTNFGCCICTPVCPEKMTDIGISCAKDTYGRGVGKPLTCKKELEYDAGLCYNKCRDKYSGVGPICWGDCPEGLNRCGALCLKEEECTDAIKRDFEEALAAIIKFLEHDTSGGFIDFSKFIKDLVHPICHYPEN
jgi:hypothetical protein